MQSFWKTIMRQNLLWALFTLIFYPDHSTLHAIPYFFFLFGVICGPKWGSFAFRDHLRSNMEIICSPGINCGTVWGSFAVLRSFAVLGSFQPRPQGLCAWSPWERGWDYLRTRTVLLINFLPRGFTIMTRNFPPLLNTHFVKSQGKWYHVVLTSTVTNVTNGIRLTQSHEKRDQSIEH